MSRREPVAKAHGGGASVWTPGAIIAGLTLRLDAGKGLSLNGSTVAAWADQSGHANSASTRKDLDNAGITKR